MLDKTGAELQLAVAARVEALGMVSSESIVIRPAKRLCHEEATRMAKLAAESRARMVIVDMTHVSEATTPGLARLVLMRRALLEASRDLRLAGLIGQPSRLLEVHRLLDVLPQIHQLPAIGFTGSDDRCTTPIKAARRQPLAPVTAPACWPAGDNQLCCA